MGKTKSFIGGFIAGGLAAGLTVLLTTPKSGREVRSGVKDKLKETSFNLIDMKTAALSVKDSVTEFTRKSVPTLKTTAREIKTIIDTWRDDIQPNIQRISSHIKELDEETEKLASK